MPEWAGTVLEAFGKLTVAGTLALAVIALIKGWLVTGREHASIVKRLEIQLAEERRETEEWKMIALQGTALAKKAVSAAWADVDSLLPEKDIR